MKIQSKLMSVFLILSVLSVSCSSTTTIRSSDPDAKIYVDGEFKGTGIVSHSDTKIIGSTTHVRIEKPNCEPVTHTFSRSEEFDVGACIGGVFVLVPFLWVMKYKPDHSYEYSCSKRKSSSLQFLDPNSGLRTSMAN